MNARTPDILASLGQGGDDSLAAAMGPQVMALNISAVRLDGGTQPRAGIDQAVVDDYANDMEANGAEFPPVQVVYDGETYWLWDGFHRLHARKRNGLYTVPAIVRQGTRRDAVLLSVGANATHGFRRTSEDKRRAVETLLRDPEWSHWSDREIARRAAVDHKTVAARRIALFGEIPQIETRRVERNGTEYTMTPPQRSEAPAVANQAANYVQVWQIEQAIKKWLPAFEEPLAVLENLKQHRGGSAYFDDLIEAGELPTPHRKGDIFQAVNNVLDQMRQAAKKPESWIVEELVEELVALESVALDGVDQNWLYEYMQGVAARHNRTFDQRTFDLAMRLAIPRQRNDNARQERLARAQAAAMAADAERARLETGLGVVKYDAMLESLGQSKSRVVTVDEETIDWRRTRGQITDDGRVLVQMSDGRKNPPWLELDDAGQHWMMDMISRAQIRR